MSCSFLLQYYDYSEDGKRLLLHASHLSASSNTLVGKISYLIKMENNAYKFIANFKQLLEHGHEMDYENLVQRVNSISATYHFQEDQNVEQGIDYCYGLNEYFGLRSRLEQLFGFGAHKYEREKKSHLAVNLQLKPYIDPGFQSVAADVIYKTKNKVLNFINNEFAYGDTDEDSDLPYQLIKNHPVTKIEQSDMVMIQEFLLLKTRDMVKYIADNKPDKWYWEEDMYCISQYLFDYFVEYTYRKVNYEDTSSLKFDLLSAFKYRKLNVPLWLQQRLNEIVICLEGIVYSINEYIKANNYQNIDFEAWLRPYFISVGQNAIKFALEQQLKEDYDNSFVTKCNGIEI